MGSKSSNKNNDNNDNDNNNNSNNNNINNLRPLLKLLPFREIFVIHFTTGKLNRPKIWTMPLEINKKVLNTARENNLNLLQKWVALHCLLYFKTSAITLRKKCPYSELFWSAFFPHSAWIWRDTKYIRIRTLYGEIQSISLYSVRMRENARKIRTRITPNMDAFYAVRFEDILMFHDKKNSEIKHSSWRISWFCSIYTYTLFL